MFSKNSYEHPEQQVAPPLVAAAEACKSFDESKEQINKEFEEEKSELQPKVLETYEASLEEIKVFEKDGDNWKAKVLPKTAKAAAAEACKFFDESKEQINKEFEEEKSELQPKVLETYEASLEEIKVFENDGDNWKAKVPPKTAKAAAAEACKFFDESKEQINKEFEEEKSELQPKVLETYEASLEEIKVFENDGDDWEAKVLPKTAKAAAAEACKFFDESKKQINKEFEEKKSELQPKVLEIYEASSVEIKTLVEETQGGRTEEALSSSSRVPRRAGENREFPGSKPVSEASSKYGPASVSGPIFFVFEKVSTFIVTEEKVEPPPEATTTTEEEASGKDREIVIVEEEKKEEVVEKKEEVVEKIEEEKKEVVVVEGDEKAETASTELAAKVEEAVEPPKP